MQENFLFFDTETTDIQTKDVIQLGILSDNNDIYFNEYFKPIQNISFGSMAIHHITPEFLEDKPTFAEAVHDNKPIKEYLQDLANNYIWIAHNAQFDIEVLNKKGITIPNYICTFKIARNLLTEDNGKRDLESYSLQFLRYYLGLYKNEDTSHNTAHDAMSDVYFLKDLFYYLQKNSSLTTEQMMQISKEPPMIREINFGKYKGFTLEDIAKMDREYLEWLADTIEDKEDLLWNVERVLSLH